MPESHGTRVGKLKSREAIATVKVAILTGQAPDRVGGVERFVGLLVRALETRGATVRVFWPPKQAVPYVLGKLGLDEWIRGRRAGRELARSGFQPDVVIGNGTFAAGIPRGVPGIAVHHLVYAAYADAVRMVHPGFSYFRLRYLKAWPQVLASRRHVAVAVSPSAAEELLSYHGLQRVLVIQHGVDLEHFSRRPRAEALKRFDLRSELSYLVFASRIEYGKGADLIAAVAGRLPSGTRMLVASDRTLDVAHVTNLGAIGYDDMPWLLSTADVYLLPTRYEGGLSLGLLEAMACGVPFITTPVGGARELLKHTNLCLGLLEDLNTTTFLKRIEYFLAQRSEAETLGRAARAYVERYHSLDAWSTRWSELVERVVQANRR